ncbi:hypothetical protein BOTBODRAFT_175218 [Botryobasidium botryosum FD-172 SS1]|uniref:GATA-type domain-containing protein n=1 Tax=Botryobasidium botryosum (strain FD-172 SS1) TaxID=930990 RepID=A0A067MPJ6_BOTB1|nr:hypothetical protein BOTBODRAFT_175218 [Botryobasidium botryosum FD-172 SS1]
MHPQPSDQLGAEERDGRPGDQHANLVGDDWHCSNCGCPASIAIGRRSGPLGDKTLCGACAKYYHRHRQLEAVVYNPDMEFHLKKRRDAEEGRLQVVALESEEPPVGEGSNLNEMLSSQAQSLSGVHESTNGPSYPPDVPNWIPTCLEALKAEFPYDEISVVPRLGTPLEWRLTCADCPGKLYLPGPNESLENFQVHLKNRVHRQNVSRRVQNQRSSEPQQQSY